MNILTVQDDLIVLTGFNRREKQSVISFRGDGIILIEPLSAADTASYECSHTQYFILDEEPGENSAMSACFKSLFPDTYTFCFNEKQTDTDKYVYTFIQKEESAVLNCLTLSPAGRPTVITVDGFIHIGITAYISVNGQGRFVVRRNIPDGDIRTWNKFMIQEGIIEDAEIIRNICGTDNMINNIVFTWDGEQYISSRITHYGEKDLAWTKLA